MLRALGAELARLPALMRAGLWILVVGGALDVIFHAAPEALGEQMHSYMGHDGSVAHLVTLVGMVVIALGVVSRAVQRHARSEDDLSE